MQIVNKNTFQKINIDFQPTEGNMIAYGYKEDYIEVPVELYDKEVIVVDGVVVEAPPKLPTKEELLAETETAFNAAMVEVVMYQEKPFIVSYAYDYQTLVLPAYKDDTETKFIWDATKIDGLELNKSSLTELYNLLAPKFEAAYQARKQAQADILKTST